MMVNLAQGFADRGVKVDLVLAAARGPYLASVGRDVNVVDLGSSGVASSLPKLVRYLRAKRPEALLATLRHANVVAVWTKRLARVPTRVVLRHSNMLFPNPPSSYREKALHTSVRTLLSVGRPSHRCFARGRRRRAAFRRRSFRQDMYDSQPGSNV